MSPRAMMEEGGGPVAVVKIEIKNSACANGAGEAKILESNDEPVKSAVAFPVLGGGVMESTGDGGGYAVGESGAGCREDGAVGEKDGGIELRAPGKLLRFGESAGISSFDGMNIIFGVDTEEILASDRSGQKKADAREFSSAIGDQLKLFYGHGVIPDGSSGGGRVKGFDHSWEGGTRGMGVGPSG